jgi:hypothetical protein
MPKSSSFTVPSGVTVGGLEIAVDHKVAMGVLHGVGRLGEYVEPLLGGETPFVAVAVDRLAVDVLHRDVGAAAGVHPSVEQLRDVGVVQVREDLPLLLEAAQRVGSEPIAGDQLQRDVLREAAVRALRQVDGRHAAAAEEPDDAVRPDAFAVVEVIERAADRHDFLPRLLDRGFPRARGLRPIGGVDERANVGSDQGFCALEVFQEGVAILGRQGKGLVEHAIDAGEIVRAEWHTLLARCIVRLKALDVTHCPWPGKPDSAQRASRFSIALR